jgi:hypothetical protein
MDDKKADYKIDWKILESDDKKTAARHEAGHLTVAVACGMRASAWLIPNNHHRTLEEVLWVGKTEWLRVNFKAPGHPGVMVKPADERAVAVAGLLAEAMAKREGDCFADEILDDLDNGLIEFSQTDAAGAGNDRRVLYRVLRRAEKILSKHRAFCEWATEGLYESGSITDGMAADQFETLYPKGRRKAGNQTKPKR